MHEQKGIVVPWKDAHVWLLPMIIVAESLIIIGINGNSVLFAMANTAQPFPREFFCDQGEEQGERLFNNPGL